MINNLAFILNNILMAMLVLSRLFGWHDKLSLVMTFGYLIAAFACICFLTMRNKKKNKWDVRFVVVWLLIDIAGFLCYSGIWQ